MPPPSVIILFMVFILTAVRKIGSIRFQIWQVMAGGAFLALITGEISVLNALHAIELDVMIFLLGMFVLGEALYESGALAHLSFLMFRRTRTTQSLMILFLLFMAFFSALLMNDTMAVIGTPLALMFSRRHQISAKPLLLALAFSITLGSVFSPAGNPQNLLIAMKTDLANPFFQFARHLLLPTLINLLLLFFLIRIFYKKEFHEIPLDHAKDPLKDPSLAFFAKMGLALSAGAVIFKIAASVLWPQIHLPLILMAAAGAAPILLFSPKRFAVLKKIDWHTLIFFAALFILMKSVWDSGFFQNLMECLTLNLTSLPVIFLLSLVLSQFISNVPFVALFLPLLMQSGTDSSSIFALASGSTVAGNLFILGAASNVIVVQNAEKRGIHLSFWEFSKIGLPLTLMNLLVYWLFLQN